MAYIDGHKGFIASLEKGLKHRYTPPNVPSGHDFTHVQRLIVLGDKITFIRFDLNEYRAVCWLHNLDRCQDVALDEVVQLTSGLLQGSPFSGVAQERICDAVVQHSKKDDEPGDSTLLTAFRVADKVDRFSPSGLMATASLYGHKFLLYNPDKPFGFGSTEECLLKTIYDDHFRCLEWYAMLPCDEARRLIVPNWLRLRLEFLRCLGQEIAATYVVENKVEGDIRRALGSFYEEVMNLTGLQL